MNLSLRVSVENGINGIHVDSVQRQYKNAQEPWYASSLHVFQVASEVCVVVNLVLKT